jgi:hypothetical protein
MKKVHLAQCHLVMKDYNVPSSYNLIKFMIANKKYYSARDFILEFVQRCNDPLQYTTKREKLIDVQLSFMIRCETEDDSSMDDIMDEIIDDIDYKDRMVSVQDQKNELSNDVNMEIEWKRQCEVFTFPNLATSLVLRYFLRAFWCYLEETPIEWMNDELPPLFIKWCKFVVHYGNYGTTYQEFETIHYPKYIALMQQNESRMSDE